MKKISLLLSVALLSGGLWSSSSAAFESKNWPDGYYAYAAHNYSKAKEIWQREADRGCHYSQYYLASMYYSGLGVPVDKAEALKWATKSAAQGNRDGESMLGMMNRFGDGGLPVNEAKALEWFERSAQHGSIKGMTDLGMAYRNGEMGLPVDYSKAYQLLYKAADPRKITHYGAKEEVGSAQALLGNMYYNGMAVQRNVPLSYALVLVGSHNDPAYKPMIANYVKSLPAAVLQEGERMAARLSVPETFYQELNALTQ